MKKNILLGIFYALLYFFNPLQAQQTINQTIDVLGVKRSFILYKPTIYNGNSPVPLLFCFHGYNMQAREQMTYGDFRPIADTANFILVYPQGSLMNNITHWNIGGWTLGSTANDIGFTRAMIDSIRKNYNIDTTRIYSTGYSNGGFFSFELACQMGEKIAAIGSVSGSITPETYAHCDPNHPMPIIQLHGTADPTIHYTGESYSLPIDSTLQYWIKINKTDTAYTLTQLPDVTSSDACTAESHLYDNGLFCNAILHYKIIGGKHGWPGTKASNVPGINQDMNASQAIWNFVSQYSIHGKIGCATLGIPSTNYATTTLYPNPFSDFINLSYQVNTPTPYTICNVLGEVVQTGNITENNTLIDLSHLHTGWYVLKINNHIFKLVKNAE